MCDNQTLNYPDQDIKPLNPGEVDVNTTKIFRFKWASDNIDNILSAGMVCHDYLDIGACDGYMSVVVAKKKNNIDVQIHVDAIEPHNQSFGVINDTAKLARNADLDVTVYKETFEDYETDKRYDIITAFEILEHAKDPVLFLEKIYNLLKVGGSLMMSVPEENGRYGKTDNNPHHYWLFNIQSLVQMFDEKRWRVFQVFEAGNLIHIIVQKVG
jgi:2-polyprenyl-3-methyl-5-hydroxy-6-metoxy-1,4-benzoquinol methylase